jgi:membrane protease YdiL (CAAX protease family)
MAPGRKRLLSLWIFLLASTVASWAVWFSPIERAGSFHVTAFGLRLEAPSNLTKLMIGICLPGVFAVLWSLSQGRKRFLELLSTLFRWRAPLKWYLLAIALPWSLFWVSLGVVLLHFPSSHPRPSFSWFLENILLLLPFGPLWEELAWRAYALRELQSHYSHLKSALIIGMYWAAWHIPLWWATLGLNSATMFPVLISAIVSVVAWSVIFSFLYNRTSESLPVVILLHAAYDSATATIFPSVQIGQLHYIGLSAVLSVCLAAMLAVSMQRSDAGVLARTRME